MRLEGKSAVVTGGGRGLGRAFTLALAKEGADVAIYDVSIDTAEKVAEEVRRSGRYALALQCDLSRKTDVIKATRQVLDEFGKIDILVNNAGVCPVASAIETTEEIWDKTVDINLKGTFLCNQIIGSSMIKRKQGRIINIASLAAHFGAPGGIAYHTSKAGVVSFTKALSVEWAKYGIYVNSISLGTTLTESVIEKLDSSKWSVDRIPMKRFGEPEEIANLALFLASPETTYITGHDFIIDGGTSALMPTYVERK